MGSPLRSLFLAVAVLSAAPCSPARAQGAGAPKVPLDKACSLFSKEEFEKLSGSQLYTDPEPMALAGGGGSLCSYDGDAGQIMLYADPKGDPFEGMLKSFGHEKLARQAAPEVGPDAYMVFVAPKNQYQAPVGFLATRSGTWAVGLTLGATDGQPPESVKPTLSAFGKAVLAKLE